MEFDRDLLGTALREGLVEITFTKKNGEERVMKCTLKESLIPVINKPKSYKETDTLKTGLKKTAEALPVYELYNGWRSFRWDSLKAWTRINGHSHKDSYSNAVR